MLIQNSTVTTVTQSLVDHWISSSNDTNGQWHTIRIQPFQWDPRIVRYLAASDCTSQAHGMIERMHRDQKKTGFAIHHSPYCPSVLWRFRLFFIFGTTPRLLGDFVCPNYPSASTLMPQITATTLRQSSSMAFVHNKFVFVRYDTVLKLLQAPSFVEKALNFYLT